MTQLLERIDDFPGVQQQITYRRIYPYAPLAAHVVGTMGAITAESEDYYKGLGYDTSNQGERVGTSGVEAQYETTLHGQWGRVVVEIDTHGNIVREISRTEPVNGQDIRLSIDLDVQQYAEQLLQTKLRIQRNWVAPNPIIKKPDGSRQRMSLTRGNFVSYEAPAGSVVVMNNATGQVIAMASYPTFDNRWFVTRISGDKFNELFRRPLVRDGVVVTNSDGTPRDDPDQAALTNRAIQGQYNLGSTFKPFVGWAAFEAGLIDGNSTYDDDGVYEAQGIEEDICATGIKCAWRNSTCGNGLPCVYGRIDLAGALAVSSDGFFYWLGERFFELPGTEHEALTNLLGQFGFGRETGVDLPDEVDGRVPSNENKANLVERGVLLPGETPRLLLGDIINLSIGQGLLAASPLQLAVAYSAFANGGYLMVPRVVEGIYAPNTPRGGPLGSSEATVDLNRAVLVQSMTPTGTPIHVSPEAHDEIVAGLRDNILGNGRNGRSTTAGELFGLEYNAAAWTWPVAGKTGTAQGANSYPWNDSSVFAAIPVDGDPNHAYTVVAYLEKSGYGSQAAAPVVKCMYMALADPARMNPVSVSAPLDITSDRAAELLPPLYGDQLSCMGTTTNGDNITQPASQTRVD
jgi:penicillin-binding protein 2